MNKVKISKNAIGLSSNGQMLVSIVSTKPSLSKKAFDASKGNLALAYESFTGNSFSHGTLEDGHQINSLRPSTTRNSIEIDFPAFADVDPNDQPNIATLLGEFDNKLDGNVDDYITDANDDLAYELEGTISVVDGTSTLALTKVNII